MADSIAYEIKGAGDLLEEGRKCGGRLEPGTSTNGIDLESSRALFGRLGGFDYLLSGTRRSGGDYQDGDGDAIVGTQAGLTDFAGKFAYEKQTGHRLEFAASRTEDEGPSMAQADPGAILFIRPDFAGVAGRPSVPVDGLSPRTSCTLTYSHTDPVEMWDPALQLSYNEQQIDAVGVYGTNKSMSGTFRNTFTLANESLTAGIDFFKEAAEGEGGWALNRQWRFGGTAEIALRNDDAALTLSSYKTINLYAAYTPEILKNFELRLDLRNLFDETYVSRSSDGIDSTRVIALNEPGRTIGLTGRLKF